MKEENKIETFKEFFEDGSVLLYKKNMYISNFLMIFIFVLCVTSFILSSVNILPVSFIVALIVVYLYKKQFGEYEICMEDNQLYDGMKKTIHFSTEKFLNAQKFVGKENGKIEIVSFNESYISFNNPFPWFNFWYIFSLKINNKSTVNIKEKYIKYQGEIISFLNENCCNHSEAVVSIKKTVTKKRYGIKDRQGNWVIQPIYYYIGESDEKGFLQATKATEDKIGFIDRHGNWVIQPIYDYLRDFDENGYSIVGLSSNESVGIKWGCIDRKGNWIIQPIYENLNGFDKYGYCIAEGEGNKWGCIDRKGNWIIQPIFDYCYRINEDEYFGAEINDKRGIIDRQGNWVIQPFYETKKGDYWIKKKLSDKKFLIEHGQSLTDDQVKTGVIDNQGNWIVQPIFDYCDFQEEEYFIVNINNKFGIIDAEGEWIIQAICDDFMGKFDDEGYKKAKTNDKWGFIDRQGNWVIQPIYDYLGWFDNEGRCTGYLKEKGESQVINRNGKLLNSEKINKSN